MQNYGRQQKEPEMERNDVNWSNKCQIIEGKFKKKWEEEEGMIAIDKCS